ncbi:signal transduction histidine kinase [Hydrocarboniphaga effusa AP103]|uniref:histidine kinase n=3 Tax=Hydrocarboniphaga effusa TaxID=243629 RepID=I7ZCH3_9GAMM|nr:sensor histidine kinase [Hydrocarboniphaga effusa]EIT69559.1 signal transduction histidine kinase [Hydrocarboniphaga effusa AP103]
MHSPSIRRSLLTIIGGVFVISMLLVFAAARAYGARAANLSYDRLLTASALSIVEALTVIQGELSVDLPYSSLSSLSQAPEDRVFYRIAGPQGDLVTGQGDLPWPKRTPAGEAPLFFDAEYSGETVRFAMLRRWIAAPGLRGWATVQIGQTRRAREAFARDIVLRSVLPIAALTLLALGAVWLGVYRALRPLRRIEQELLSRSPSDLSPVSAPVPVEMTAMVHALDRFMGRLSLNIATLRAFIAEAAHQIRTPLAILRAQAQNALDEDDVERQRRAVVVVEDQATRLTRLVNQLLSDAAVIHRADLRCFDEVLLADVVRQALRDSLPRADADLRVRFDCEAEDAQIQGDAMMLREAIKNLVDNALRYGCGEAPANEPDLALRLYAHGSAYRIEVADRGPGIAQAERATVFERFSRGSTAKPGGAGLGLAIVRRVAESHGGTVSLHDREGGGLRIRIELPRGSA